MLIKRLLVSLLILFSISGVAGDLKLISKPRKSPSLEVPGDVRRGLGDPEIHRAWHLEAIGASQAWHWGKGDDATVLAIVDSGVDYTHPEIAPNLAWNTHEWPTNKKDSDGNGFVDDVIGWNFVGNNNLPYDRSGHGTYLASIAVAADDNGVGTAGVCPRCRLLPVRFLNWEGLGDTEDAIAGLYYAISRGARVINFSFSGEGYDRALAKAILAAAAKDILVVVAASNDGENVDRSDTYPAKFNFANMITVAATDREGNLWQHSNWSKKSVHVAAPGVAMLGLWFGTWDSTGNGTSMAAAVVSGAASLIRSIAPHLSAVEVKQILMSTVTPYQSLRQKIHSQGVINLEAAAQCASQVSLPCLRSSKEHSKEH